MPSVLAPWGFDDVDERVYRAILRQPGVLVEELATQLDLTVDDVLRAARKLVRNRLVRRRGEGVTATRPDLGIAGLVGDTEAAIRRQRDELGRLQRLIGQLVHDHALGERDRGEPPGVEMVLGAVAVRATLADLTGRAPQTLLCARRERPRPRAPLRDLLLEDLPGSATVRLLVAAPLLDAAERRTTMAALSRRGIGVRVAGDVPFEAVIAAGDLAVLPVSGPGDPADDHAVVVRNPTLVATLAAVFELVWDHATPVVVDRGQEPGVDGELVALLAAGLQDEAVGRELDVSVRTVRRRVARLLTTLHARTRFQAGVHAARRGPM